MLPYFVRKSVNSGDWNPSHEGYNTYRKKEAKGKRHWCATFLRSSMESNFYALCFMLSCSKFYVFMFCAGSFPNCQLLVPVLI